MKTDISKAASTLGRKGGSSTSARKQEAARENGRKGGRPRTSGYMVWAFGEKWWHRTLKGAHQHELELLNYANGFTQIIECATGNAVEYVEDDY